MNEQAKNQWIYLCEAFRKATQKGHRVQAQKLALRISKYFPGAGKLRCPTCGFRIRGDNHFEGQHHNMGSGTYKDSKGQVRFSKRTCKTTKRSY